jgi:hypothetical protein
MKRLLVALLAALLALSTPAAWAFAPSASSQTSTSSSGKSSASGTTVETLCIEGRTLDGTWHECQ